ncbi:MAG: hypothetical protein ABSC22_11800 [Roseiarcus sp.]|jgi:K+-transporting ATPase c subunit
MNEHEESRREPSFEAGQGEGASKVEPPRLHLVPFPAPSSAKAAGVRTSVVAWASGLAAGLALLAAVAAAGLYDHVRQSNLLAAKAEESHSLAQTVRALKDRIDAIEAARAHDETADLRKVTVEMKAESGATRDLSGALAQLTARLDRVDHDQSARLDKLADRIDRESTARIADLATRLDKLEKKPPAAVVASLPPPPAKPDPGVSNETTGSIEKPRAPLRGYWVVDVQDGVAIIDGRDGPRQVAPGDVLPGAGRVERIERHGRDWVVVTSSGTIAGDQAPF